MTVPCYRWGLHQVACLQPQRKKVAKPGSFVVVVNQTIILYTEYNSHGSKFIRYKKDVQSKASFALDSRPPAPATQSFSIDTTNVNSSLCVSERGLPLSPSLPPPSFPLPLPSSIWPPFPSALYFPLSIPHSLLSLSLSPLYSFPSSSLYPSLSPLFCPPFSMPLSLYLSSSPSQDSLSVTLYTSLHIPPFYTCFSLVLLTPSLYSSYLYHLSPSI